MRGHSWPLFSKSMNRLKLFSVIIAIFALFSCNKENKDNGFSNVDNPRAERLVSVYGETVSITFDAKGPWQADIVCDNEGWASIFTVNGNDAAGKGTIKVKFDKNTSEQSRKATLYIKVSGYSRAELASFEQASGTETDEMNDFLIKEMEKRLSTEYLWAAEYNKLTKENVTWDKYLATNLPKLGDVNIEDGGYYRDYSSYAGQRYIYSYIQEINGTKADELTPMYGLGIGPMMSMMMYENSDIVGLNVGYVYRGSPADEAGLQRGDFIYSVNGTTVTTSNYQTYMQQLFDNPSGTYNLVAKRYVYSAVSETYIMVDKQFTISSASYGYDPILFAAVASNTADSGNGLPAFKFGYMVTESFDLSAQVVIEDQIKQFVDENITDMILDLRYNVGGAVPQSRYISSAVVGPSHDDDIFFKAEYVDGRIEDWTFGYGYTQTPDGLTHAPNLGLNRLFVIVSESTASASELLINSLKGIDFPITVIGSRTEGKNVGMVVSTINYNGRKFEFAPITFRCYNAKGEGDYKDGMLPSQENLLNNQNNDYGDDLDSIFPYAFGNWDDMSFNLGVYLCLCDITGVARPQLSQTKSSSDNLQLRQAQELGRSMRPLSKSSLKPSIGRFGNIIYAQE